MMNPFSLPSVTHPCPPKNGTHLGLTWDSHASACGRNRECNLSFRIALQRKNGSYALTVNTCKRHAICNPMKTSALANRSVNC